MNSQLSSDPAQTQLEPSITQVAAQCAAHGEYQAKLIDLGFGDKPLTSGCPTCGAERRAQEASRAAERKAVEERMRIARLFGASGIPERFCDRRLSTYVATTAAQKRVLDIAQRFADTDEPGASLVLCGKPGTGKTHLACGIASALIERGESAMFRTVVQAVRHIKDTYRRDSLRSESEAIEDLLRPDLLILDEIGVQIGSEHEKMLVFEIINERYQRRRSTILISNLSREELTAYLGERIMDRFREGGGVVAFDWTSYRGKAP
jgi:DNA replication protein DnaC